MKKYFFLLVCIALPMLIFAQKSAPAFQIFDVKGRKTCSLDELAASLKQTDVLVFGEEHNDSTGHDIEAQLFAKMLATYPGTSLSLEMFSTDVQPIINEYLAGLISEKNFIKESRAWPNYKDYQPLIELAKSNKANVIAANIATRYSNVVSMSGLARLQDFPAASKAYLPPLPIDTAAGRYYDKFTETLGGHAMGGMKIYETQNLWDASMAWSIARYAGLHQKNKILHVNGRFHSDEQLGVIAQLKKYAPKLKVNSISCFAGEGSGAPDWNKYAGLADYIIITH